jgi:hypothetical protein
MRGKIDMMQLGGCNLEMKDLEEASTFESLCLKATYFNVAFIVFIRSKPLTGCIEPRLFDEEVHIYEESIGDFAVACDMPFFLIDVQKAAILVPQLHPCAYESNRRALFSDE